MFTIFMSLNLLKNLMVILFKVKKTLKERFPNVLRAIDFKLLA
ncbi:hypothetical protein [Citrobacter pasteurii]|nr:hypothetical protein [Citrobacter pasteurii]